MSILPDHHLLQHAEAIGHHHIDSTGKTPPKTMSKLQEPGIDTTSLITGPKLDDPSFKSTWVHCAWVATGCTIVLITLASSIIGSFNSRIWLEPILSGFAGYLFADLGIGVYHWVIDNYGDASTPIIGSQIEEFQGHHQLPWWITKRQFANNSHVLARVVTYTVLPMDLIIGHDHPVVMGFIGMAGGCILFSQLIHSWAHETKNKLPPLVVALQDVGVLVSRSQHAAHHRPPYNNNYCIVSGVWNRFLDEHRVFEALEMMVFFKFGLRPRSWGVPNSNLTEETTTSLS